MAQNNKIKIQTPKGQFIQQQGTGGKTSCRLEWNPGFGAKMTNQFSAAQKFVDSEVLRLDAPYMPLQTGTLIKSGTLGTEIGSGEVQYTTPYAAEQYYNTASSRPYNPKRGGHWFERMKIDHKDTILRGAKQKAGG